MFLTSLRIKSSCYPINEDDEPESIEISRILTLTRTLEVRLQSLGLVRGVVSLHQGQATLQSLQ